MDDLSVIIKLFKKLSILRKRESLQFAAFLTNEKHFESKNLYSEAQQNWSKGAKMMFRMSSEIDN